MQQHALPKSGALAGKLPMAPEPVVRHGRWGSTAGKLGAGEKAGVGWLSGGPWLAGGCAGEVVRLGEYGHGGAVWENVIGVRSSRVGDYS